MTHAVSETWTLHQGPNVLAIPGTSSLKHLEENVAAGDLHLTARELEWLERLFGRREGQQRLGGIVVDD